MFLSSAIITVHLENLRHNLKTLLARHPSLMPVIKADAYGHGVVAVARVLAEEGIQHMAVGSVGEGALLRQEGHTAFLLALMGLARDEDTALAASYDITPLVHSRESLERILAQSHLTGRAKPLTVAIKFDTGMSRLGFRVDEAAELAIICVRSRKCGPCWSCRTSPLRILRHSMISPTNRRAASTKRRKA